MKGAGVMAKRPRSTREEWSGACPPSKGGRGGKNLDLSTTFLQWQGSQAGQPLII